MAIKDEIELFRKDRIRGQAERLFYERGFRGTSMDAIAESLDATKPFLYVSYPKKTDILYDTSTCVSCGACWTRSTTRAPARARRPTSCVASRFA
ncbi:MAG TPA: helix-turn-helix domain-containing protein [Burkholderiaceae bacterium]